MTRTAPAAFYFDLASPLRLPGGRAHPAGAAGAGRVAAGARARARGARETLERAYAATARASDRLAREIERRARELELQPLRWPEPFPFDSSLAMRVATYATSIGRAVPFAQAAFRQAFAGGHSLERPRLRADRGGRVRDAPGGGAARRRAALGRPSSSRRATAAAAARASRTCPRCVVGERVFVGERALERAAAQHARARMTLARGGESRGGGAMKAAHAYRLIVTRGGLRAGAARGPDARRPHRGRRDRQRRSGAVLGSPAAGRVEARARAARGPRAARGRGVHGALEYRGALMPSLARAARASLPSRARARVARDDDADPPLRGARRRDVRARQGRRLPAPVDRRGGDDRRQRAGAARRTTT